MNGARRKASTELAALRERLRRHEGRRFWRSLDELAETEEFLDYLQREFPDNAAYLDDAVSRRNFLKLMGASLALAGATACTGQPAERIIPYVRQPEGLVPGKPRYYASAAPRYGYAHGVLVESHMGRPTKVEGNPAHPASLGATDAVVQAQILELYDPDRSQVVRRNGRISTWQSFLATVTAAMTAQAGSGGAGLRLLMPPGASPTLARQLTLLRRRYPNARVHHYQAAARHGVTAGARQAFGEVVDTRYRFERADVIVALDADFLSGMPGSVRYARDFADRRRVRADRREMNRLYAVECSPSPTGAIADHRAAARPSQIEAVARALAARLGVAGLRGGDAPPGAGEEPAPGTGDDPAPTPTASGAARRALPQRIDAVWIDAVAADLRAHAGRSVVLAGDQQPAPVHALAHAINAHLGNDSVTVEYIDPVAVDDADPIASLAELVADMDAGAVTMLAILGGNPVYDAPADLDFASALSNVELRLHLGAYSDETAALCHWHVPEAHYLEAWSDLRAFDGTAAVVQPLIEPLYRGRSVHEVVAVLLEQPERDGYDIVRETWRPGAAAGEGEGADDAGSEDFWRRAVHDGVIPGTAYEPRTMSLRGDWDVAEGTTMQRGTVGAQDEGDTLELTFRPDPTIHDGRYANNGWLQELPKPLTLLTWDNAALVSPATAERLQISNEQRVSIEHDGREVHAPVWIVPGHPDGALTLHLGYGRRRTGRVGRNAGFDAGAIRTTAAFWSAPAARVRGLDDHVPLATTQHHHSMEGRDLVRVGDLEDFRADGVITPGAHPAPGPEESLYPEWRYEGYSWAMQIDLNVCIGCNGCMTACQAENNVPVVGKNEVRRGREMHWLRVDRYYADRLDDPETYFQPLPCMHCDNAPCEVVCPVGATVHGSEGLNEMVYNRCVGTRYCSNNCPYKVRRFNFFDYAGAGSTPVHELAHNPDVTVRTRGVMEKCTYCVQRINAARVEAKKEGRLIEDGEVVPACAQACPTQAITFGNINDPDSEISRLRAEPLHYGLLAELGTRPRTNYLARLRNPNPAMPPPRGEVP